jgi:hypothetical protein
MTDHTSEEAKIDIAGLRAVAEDATPGPWRWRSAHASHGDAYLQGARTSTVMAFRRMGMSGAQPMFRGSDNLLYPAGMENMYNFKDAKFIAIFNPSTVLALLDEVQRLQKEADHDPASV